MNQPVLNLGEPSRPAAERRRRSRRIGAINAMSWCMTSPARSVKYYYKERWRRAQNLPLTPLRVRDAFQACPARLAGLLSKLADSRGHAPHTLAGAHRLANESGALVSVDYPYSGGVELRSSLSTFIPRAHAGGHLSGGRRRTRSASQKARTVFKAALIARSVHLPYWRNAVGLRHSP